MKETLIKWYLEYVNDFLTLKGFAEYHDISEDQANTVITLGRTLHSHKVQG